MRRFLRCASENPVYIWQYICTVGLIIKLLFYKYRCVILYNENRNSTKQLPYSAIFSAMRLQQTFNNHPSLSHNNQTWPLRPVPIPAATSKKKNEAARRRSIGPRRGVLAFPRRACVCVSRKRSSGPVATVAIRRNAESRAIRAMRAMPSASTSSVPPRFQGMPCVCVCVTHCI